MTTTPRDDGGPAFPSNFERVSGMTLRDYFAAKAIDAAAKMWEEASTEQRMLYSGCRDTDIIFQRDFPKFVANVTSWIADAMLAARRAK